MLTSTLLVAAESLSPVRSLASLIEDLHRSGLEVIYSSEIVPATLTETQPREGLPPLERARSALADHGLELRRIAPERYVVAIARAQPTAAELPAALPKPGLAPALMRVMLRCFAATEPLLSVHSAFLPFADTSRRVSVTRCGVSAPFSRRVTI